MDEDGFGPIPVVQAPENDLPSAPPAVDAAAVPESEAMRQLAARMSRESGDLPVVTHPDGRRSVDLSGRFQLMSAAVTGADGKTEIRCFSSYQEMTAAISAGKTAETPRPPDHVR